MRNKTRHLSDLRDYCIIHGPGRNLSLRLVSPRTSFIAGGIVDGNLIAEEYREKRVNRSSEDLPVSHWKPRVTANT